MTPSIMNSFKIATINVNGFNSLEKIYYTYDISKLHSLDIILLQETHVNEKKTLSQIEDIFHDFTTFLPLTKKKEKGVGILISNSINFSDYKIEIPNEDRIIILTLFFKNISYEIVNIYTPNDHKEQIKFVNSLYDILFFRKNIILGGDFNFVEDNVKERNSSKNVKEKKTRNHEDAWKQFFSIIKLKEPKFNNFFNLDSRTWRNGPLSARLDRFYLMNSLFDSNIQYSKHINFVKSDHSMVSLKVTVQNTNIKNNQKTNLWRLNDSILVNEDVSKKVIEICYDIKNYYNEENNYWYDRFINKITCLLKKESRRLNFEKNKNIKELLEESSFLSQIENQNQSQVFRKNKIVEEINSFYEEKRKFLELKNKEIIEKFDKTPTKILLSESNKKDKKIKINKITYNEKTFTESENVKEIFHNHYNILLGNKFNTEKNIDEYHFNIPTVTDENLIKLTNQEFSYRECLDIIRGMDSSSPGLNGLTITFYKIFFKYFGEYYVKMLNNGKNLTSHFNTSVIKLIPKNNKSDKKIGDYRPISITNYDYRIFTKLLSNRLRFFNDYIF